MSGSTRSYEMARRLVDFGHDVHIITSSRDKDTRRESASWIFTVESGINVHWYPVLYSNSMNYAARIRAFLKFAYASTLKSAELGADIVFASSTPLTIAIPAVICARKGKIPMVFEVRDLWPEMPIAIGAIKDPVSKYLARKLELWAYRNSDAIVALSPGMKDGVARRGYPVQQIAVIPNGSDNDEYCTSSDLNALDFRTKRPWLSDSPLLVYAGTFGMVNGLSYAIDLAVALDAIQSNIVILIVGDGRERDSLILESKERGVFGKNIFFENSIPKVEIPSLLSCATMACNFVIDLPEARANSANKFFDCLAAGRPIFLNHGGWMHDLVVQHQCGLSVWGSTIDNAASLLNDRMNDTDWIDASGRRAKLLAEKYFDRSKLAAQLNDVLIAVYSDQKNIVADIAPGEFI